MSNALKDNVVLALVIICSTMFALLSVLHVYWSQGGELWYKDVLPTNSKGTSRLNPSPTSAVIVAVGMLILALIVTGSQGVFDTYVDRKYFRIGTLLIAILFLLRAIGDFKFFGLFKTIKHTRFAINDTQLFTPFCLFIALSALIIFWFSRR